MCSSNRGAESLNRCAAFRPWCEDYIRPMRTLGIFLLLSAGCGGTSADSGAVPINEGSTGATGTNGTSGSVTGGTGEVAVGDAAPETAASEPDGSPDLEAGDGGEAGPSCVGYCRGDCAGTCSGTCSLFEDRGCAGTCTGTCVGACSGACMPN